MRTNEVTRRIIAAAYTVHSEIGPGLLESAYAPCMALEMTRQRLRFVAQHPVPLIYHGVDVGCGFRADFLVEDVVIVELKAVAGLDPVFTAQMITYLKLSGCRVGLLLNFNVTNMQTGVKRIVYGFRDGTGEAEGC